MAGRNMFSIAKADEEKRMVFGWASVSADPSGKLIEDLQGDMVGIDELEHAAYEYVLEFRDAGERHDPAKRKKGRLVESVVFTPEKVAAMGIQGAIKKAWWVGFYIDDDEAWAKIKAGEYEMFSIEGKAVREEVAKSFTEQLIVLQGESSHAGARGIMGIAKSFLEWFKKFNPYHGPDGKFTTGDVATMFVAMPNTIASNAKIGEMLSYFEGRRKLMGGAAQALGIAGNTLPKTLIVNGKFRINLLNVENGGGSDPSLDQHLAEAQPKPKPKITVTTPDLAGKPFDWAKVQGSDVEAEIAKKMPGVDQIVDALEKQGYDLSSAGYIRSRSLVDTKQNGDMALTEIYKHRGFNAQPTMMDKDAVKDYIAKKKAPELYRGMGTSSNGQSGEDKQTRFAQDPLHFAGLGVLGNGTYAAQTPARKLATNTGLRVARNYSGGAINGTVRMTLDKSAKRATYSTVANERISFQLMLRSAVRSGHLSSQKANALFNLSDDVGRFAALRGYDAYYERGSKHSGANASHPFWVLLNRGKIIIQNERYT